MSASVTTSSRRRPAHATSSSSDAKRWRWSATALAERSHSCEQTLQKQPRSLVSNIDGSSQPHFGQIAGPPSLVECPSFGETAFAACQDQAAEGRERWGRPGGGVGGGGRE